MVNIQKKSFMESFFQFLRKSDPKFEKANLFGKIVGIDTKHRSSDGYGLVHIYRLSDKDGKTGTFLGNIKYKSKLNYFRRNIGGDFIESVEGWRELTPSELKTIGHL